MNSYARMLISKAEANRSIWHGQAHEPDPCRKNMDEIREEREEEHSKEERSKFIKKENSLKPVGAEREIIGEEQVDNYTPPYYKTKDWRSRSKALIEKAGGKCSKCNYEGKGLTIHHLTYGYKPHTEPEEVLECLCKDCHHLKHEINRIIHGSSSRKIDQLWNIPSRKTRKEKLIKTKIEEFAPWMLGDDDYCEASRGWRGKLYDFLNTGSRGRLYEIYEKTQSLIESNRASALVIKSYQVSTSGDTRQHKDKMRKSFGLSWKRFKKQWEGRVTDEELKEFTEYCEGNEIEYTVG
jgi:hypothetical protein